MLKTNKRESSIVISGPSGTGKDSVINKLKEINNNFWLSISCTSRSPRKNEIDGKDYFFLTKEEFEEKIAKGKLIHEILIDKEFIND